jgi:hypothetical protein
MQGNVESGEPDGLCNHAAIDHSSPRSMPFAAPWRIPAYLTDKETSAPVASDRPLALHVPARSSLSVRFHPICDSPLHHLRHQGFWLITTVNARPCSQVISLAWASGWYGRLPCLAQVLSSSRMFLPLHAPPEGYQIILLAHLFYDR